MWAKVCAPALTSFPLAILAVINANAASVILNEYNAVGSSNYLDGSGYGINDKQDPYFGTFEGMSDGRIQGNGGNWFELVVVEDQVDMRGWQLRWVERDTNTGTADIWTGDATEDQGIIRLSNSDVWSSLQAGTIITISEQQFVPVDTTPFGLDRNFTLDAESDGGYEVVIDLSTDTSFNPAEDDWWIHVSTLDELDSPEPLVTAVTNVMDDGPGFFSVGNSTWQLTIVDAAGNVEFGPVGERIGRLSGVGSEEVGKLEEDPSPEIEPETASYNDGTSSSFGAPNVWSNGMMIQDFSALRAAPRLQAGDANEDLEFNQVDLVKVQVAGLYLSGSPATWGDGDWNGAPGGSPGSPPAGNGRFDQADVVAALTAGFYLTGPYAAVRPDGNRNDGQTSIGYDATTGEVWVDAPAATELTSVNIDSAAGIFTGDPARNLGGSFDNDADRNIFKATFGSSFGSLSFGSVARQGLSQEFLLNDLTVIGSLAGGGSLGEVDLIYVPEPSGILYSIVALLGFSVLRGKGIW